MADEHDGMVPVESSGDEQNRSSGSAVDSSSDSSENDDGSQSDSSESSDLSKELKAKFLRGGKNRYFGEPDISVTCYQCGEVGHIAADCNNAKQQRRCYLCGKTGHESNHCTEIVCFRCGKPGHQARECTQRSQTPTNRTNRPQTFTPESFVLCIVCGQQGHMNCSDAKNLYLDGPSTADCCYCGQSGHDDSNCREKHSFKRDRSPGTLEQSRPNKRRRGRPRERDGKVQTFNAPRRGHSQHNNRFSQQKPNHRSHDNQRSRTPNHRNHRSNNNPNHTPYTPNQQPNQRRAYSQPPPSRRWGERGRQVNVQYNQSQRRR